MICGAEGCPNQARAKGRFCSDACRSRDWKARTKYQRPEPTASSGNGGERRSGGLQVSYQKVVTQLRRDLVTDLQAAGWSRKEAFFLISRSVRAALPDRQRTRLDGR